MRSFYNMLAVTSAASSTRSARKLLLVFFMFAVVVSFTSNALRMIDLDAPDIALQGDTISLICHFSLNSAEEPAAKAQSQQQRSTAAARNYMGSAFPARRQPSHFSILNDDSIEGAASLFNSERRKRANFERYSKLPTTTTTNLQKFTSESKQQQLKLASGVNEFSTSTANANLRNGAGNFVKNNNLEQELLCVKWYKNGREFFRYLTSDWPKKQVFFTEGIHADLDKSDNHTVVLKNVSLKTSGLFRCEVSTDAPDFVTKSIERKMLIYSMPNVGPSIDYSIITSSNHSSSNNNFLAPTSTYTSGSGKPIRHLFLGDQVEFVCVSSESKPAASLDWLLNDKLNLTNDQSNDQNHQLLSQFGQIKSQRFVQLPIINGSISLSNSALQQMNQPNGRTNHYFKTYEIYEGNLAVPIESSSAQNSTEEELFITNFNISLEDKLDQVLEMSAIKLNLNINANLFRLIEQIATSENSNNNNANQNLQLKPISVYNLASNLKKNSGKKVLKTTKNNIDRFTLKIKCNSRILNLNMSDEIKFQLINKTRDNQAVINAQERQLKPQSSRSGGDSSAGALPQKYHSFLQFIAIISISINYALMNLQQQQQQMYYLKN